MPYALQQIPALHEQVKVIDLTSMAADIINQNPSFMSDLVRKQLYSGRNKAGALLTPSYSEDPWFNEPGAAERYARWKSRITPDDDRPEDTPNLFISGKYHGGLEAYVQGEQVVYVNGDSNASAIEAKFGGKDTLYGLNEQGIERFRAYVVPLLRERLLAIFKKAIGYG